MVKTCTYCEIEKPFKDFHKGRGMHNLKSQCILCCKRHYDPIKARNSRRKHQMANREEYRKRSKNYDISHKPERAAREAYRRAQKLKASPKWLTQVHKDQIVALYKLREYLSVEKGIIYHVDHVMPLVSKDICGLHVPWNLQVIEAVNNLKKGNKV